MRYLQAIIITETHIQSDTIVSLMKGASWCPHLEKHKEKVWDLPRGQLNLR